MTQQEVERLISTMSTSELKRALITINNMDLEEYPMTRDDFFLAIRQALNKPSV